MIWQADRVPFMVEMTEVAISCETLPQKDLLILVKYGRGTSTFDGLSIAWAVIEHISNTRILGAENSICYPLPRADRIRRKAGRGKQLLYCSKRARR